ELLERYVPLCVPILLSNSEVHNQPVAILHERMSGEGELCRRPRTLLCETRLGVGRRCMRLVASSLTAKVDRRVAGIVRWRAATRGALLGVEALERGPRLDEGTVDGEVLVAHELRVFRLAHDLPEELLRDIGLDEPLSVLGKRARIEAGLRHVHVQEPS